MTQPPSGNPGHPPSAQTKPETIVTRLGWAVLVVVFAALSIFVIFRPFFVSHTDFILSDPGDGRFEVMMLEHWTKALHGQVQLSSPIFFYPERGVLGYSDALLGIGVPFAGFRYLGADRYLALEYTMMLVTSLGFIGMYCALRDGLRFARPTALAGSLLFIVSNMYYIDLVHVHLNFVVVAPWLLWLIAKYLRTTDTRRPVALAWLCLASLLLAVIFYTAYYIGWFLVLCSAAGVIFYLGGACFAERSPRPLLQVLQKTLVRKWDVLLAGTVFVSALIPFFILYLPSLRRTGKRSMAEALYFLPRALGIFDVGKYNVVWGRLAGRIEDFISPGGIHEHPTGWPLITFCLFLATALYCLSRLLRLRGEQSVTGDKDLYLMAAIALTCLTLWLAGVKFGEHAPVWGALWRWVPGAAAIRVPSRINLVLNIGVVILCMFGLDNLTKSLFSRGTLGLAIPVLLVAALFVEQLNLMPTHLISRTEEAHKFSWIPAPPKECAEFYVSNWGDDRIAKLLIQTDAMMVANIYEIPTIDGYSSWFPYDWDLMNVPRGHVAEEAFTWARAHRLSEGLCALDLNSGVWTKKDLSHFDPSANLGEDLEGKFANPGFEDRDLARWPTFQAVHATLSTDQPHSGAQTLAETEGVGSVFQDVKELEPGRKYRIAVWVSSSPGATAGAQIAVWDPGFEKVTFSKGVHPQGNWQLLTDFVTVSQAGLLRVHLFRLEGSGTIYWDDVRIYRDDGTRQPVPPE